MLANSRIISAGTATQDHFYSQNEVLDLFQIKDKHIRSIFLNSTIKKRSLKLPIKNPEGTPNTESQGELLEKHRQSGIAMGVRAIKSCLKKINAHIEDIQCLYCVTSTGFLTPGFSALLCEILGLKRNCVRLDIVGMGCNAGLNGLNASVNWTRSNPGKLAIMLCIEVCSAAYVFDNTIQSAVVNSLFGDGAAAIALMSNSNNRLGPEVLKFSSYIITEALNAMKFNWNEEHGKFDFFLDSQVPYIIGAHTELVINELLKETTFRRSDVAHWIVHSGGKKVIDSIRINLGLTRHDLRHTYSVLSDYGNLSSGSFLFSYERLLDENEAVPGDIGILMTMGPGSTIESTLVRW